MAAAKQRATVVGVFSDRQKANEAVSELMKAGFNQNQIGVAMRHAEGEERTTAGDEAAGTSAGTGALTGALTGLGLGALTGLGVLAGMIPVVGPAIAAGTLGVVVSNAAAGAGIAGLAGALIGAGVSEDEASYYSEEFNAGRTIVTVTTDTKASEATGILRKYGAYDVSDRGSRSDASYASTGAAGARSDMSTGQRDVSNVGHSATREGATLQAKEERLRADKHPVEAGEVTVRKEVHTETRHIDVPVEREEVIIERTPGHGQRATEGIQPGEEIRVPVREEHVTVTKEPVVTEEVKIGKRTVQDTERVTGEVRKEEIKVDESGAARVKDRDAGKGGRRS